MNLCNRPDNQTKLDALIHPVQLCPSNSYSLYNFESCVKFYYLLNKACTNNKFLIGNLQILNLISVSETINVLYNHMY